MYKLGSHCLDLHEIWYWRLVTKIQISLKSVNNTGHFTWRPKWISHFWQKHKIALQLKCEMAFRISGQVRMYSMKYFVDQQQPEENTLLNFHVNTFNIYYTGDSEMQCGNQTVHYCISMAIMFSSTIIRTHCYCWQNHLKITLFGELILGYYESWGGINTTWQHHRVYLP